MFRFCYPFKRQPRKMVKHTQRVRWQKLTNCFTILWRWRLKGLFCCGQLINWHHFINFVPFRNLELSEKNWQPLTIFVKSSILDDWLGFKCSSENYWKFFDFWRFYRVVLSNLDMSSTFIYINSHSIFSVK